MSTRGKTELHISWTAAAIVPGLLFAITATADAAETNIRKSARCKATIEKALQQITRRHALARGLCAERQIAGSLHDGADCMATPRPLGGPGVGHQDIDARFAGIRRKVRRVALRVAKTCPPPEYTPRLLGLDQLCPDPDDAASNYSRMMECGYDLVRASADRLQALVYKGPGNAAAQISREEALCRSGLSENLRRVLRGRISARSECFKRYNRGDHQLNCMATSAAPGTRESTGVRSVDRELEEQMLAMRNSALRLCPVDLGAMGFTSTQDVDDPTPGTPFSNEDLFHELADVAIAETTRIAATLYPGFSHCGDGVVDAALGEECDDGPAGASSCDGCDRDCTLDRCTNGSVCGEERCDDGNARIGDGCDAACDVEFCGDGEVQAGIGETCDDGNEIDCDGCDSNCTPSTLCNNGVQCENTGEQCDLGLGVCIEGLHQLRPCNDDLSCATCLAGPLTGRGCASNADCGPGGEYPCDQARCGGTCAGGARDAELCAGDGECTGACVEASGGGLFCTTDRDCEPGLMCNRGRTCVLPLRGNECAHDDDCGAGGSCSVSAGCNAGNSDSRADSCRTDCTVPVCGDGVIDLKTDTNGLGAESCDDGNLDNDDGCDSNCTPSGCGNGIVNITEQCDLGPGVCIGGIDDGAACLSADDCRGRCADPAAGTGTGPDTGTDTAETPCTYENAAIECGGNICEPALGCFGGNVDGELCRTDCMIPACGDGVLDPGEECDDGPGQCASGIDAGLDCTPDSACRGTCMTGPLTGTPCLDGATDCAGGLCEAVVCEGGNRDATPGACSTGCLLQVP